MQWPKAWNLPAARCGGLDRSADGTWPAGMRGPASSTGRAPGFFHFPNYGIETIYDPVHFPFRCASPRVGYSPSGVDGSPLIRSPLPMPKKGTVNPQLNHCDTSFVRHPDEPAGKIERVGEVGTGP